jgi:hypothetical protein
MGAKRSFVQNCPEPDFEAKEMTIHPTPRLTSALCGAFIFLGVAAAQAQAVPTDPLYEAHVWLGQTRLPGGQHETGLRSLELAVWPREGLRLFVRHDDGLARDNSAVALSDRNSALNSVGAYHRWNPQTGTALEVGSRKLIEGGDRSMVHLKQTRYLQGGTEFNLGASLGRRTDGQKDWLTYLGSSVRMSSSWKLEQVLFVSRDGVPGNSELRVHLASQHELGDGWELGGGLTLGEKKATGRQQQVREGYLRASYRIRPMVRRESVENEGGISVLSVGSTVEWR